MEIIISGRHLGVSDQMKEHAEQRLRKLAEEYPKLTSARMVMDLQRNWHLVEAHLHGKNVNLDASARTSDMYASIDSVADKLERQLRRYLDRVQDHRLKSPEGRRERLAAEAEQEAEAELAEEFDAELEEAVISKNR